MKKPVQMSFDNRGRLWVATCPATRTTSRAIEAQRQDAHLRRHGSRRTRGQTDGVRGQDCICRSASNWRRKVCIFPRSQISAC
jgi:hypothetical protein